MKFRHGAAAAVVAAAGAYAQEPSAYTAPPVYTAPVVVVPPSSSAVESAVISAPPPPFTSVPGVTYTTVTYDSCVSEVPETMITVTNGITVTYCPECEAAGTPKPSATVSGHTTVYTTTYLSLCETGTVPVTYTITESCAEPTPTWTPGPSHIPQGYTVTVKDCTVCHSDLSKPSTIPVTITEPCGCDAEDGTTIMPTKKPAPATATPTGNPVQQISDGQLQQPAGPKPTGEAPKPTGETAEPEGPGATGPAASGPAGTGPAPGSPEATAPAPTAGPYPSTAPAGPVRPEHSASVPGVNTTHVTPAAYEGTASVAGVASLMLTIAAMVGILAVAL